MKNASKSLRRQLAVHKALPACVENTDQLTVLTTAQRRQVRRHQTDKTRRQQNPYKPWTPDH